MFADCRISAVFIVNQKKVKNFVGIDARVVMEKKTFFLTVILPVYLLGSIASYFFIRYLKTKMHGRWTKFDRAMGLLVALSSSWAGIVAFSVTELFFPGGEQLNKPAKW